MPPSLLLARGGERLEQTAKDLGPGAIPFVTDVGDPGSVGRTFAEIGDRFGRIDILVNNAAVYRPCRVELLSDLDIQQQIATNLAGPVYTCRAAIPLLRAAGGGDIVNTSSESTLHPFPMLSMYVATKAALEAFALVLAQEVRDDEIRVTTVIQGRDQRDRRRIDGLGVGSRARRGGDEPLDRDRTHRPGVWPQWRAGRRSRWVTCTSSS